MLMGAVPYQLSLDSFDSWTLMKLGRGCQKLAIILRGVRGGGGGRKWSAGRLPLITFIGGGGGRSERGRARRGEREQICPCNKCSHVHVDYTLSLFLISPFCCCSLSRYKKVLQERYNYSTFILNLALRFQKYGFAIGDPGSGKKPIPDPGSRVQKAPDPESGSATLKSRL